MSEVSEKTNATADREFRPFTIDDAKDMVKAALAPGSRLKLPTKAALGHLALRLSAMRKWATEPEMPPGPVIRILSDAEPLNRAKKLAEAIVPWRAAIAYYLKHHEVPPSSYDAVVALDALSAALTEAMPFLQSSPPPERLPEGWHRIAQHTEQLFRNAMRSTNPARTLGVSSDGPIALFVAVVADRIYGKQISSGAVAKYLKRRAIPGKRVFAPVPFPIEAMRYMRRHAGGAAGLCTCALCAMERYVKSVEDKC